MFIAVISALLAILSFIINYILYLRTARILNYWNVDVTIISATDRFSFYVLCIATIYLFVTMVATGLTAISFNRYVPFKAYLLCAKNKIRQLRNLNNSDIKRIKKLNKRNSNSSKEKQNNRKQVEELTSEVEKIKLDIRSIQNDLSKIKKDYNKAIRPNLVIVVLILIPTDFLIISSIITQNVFISMLYFVIICLTQFFLYYVVTLFITNIMVRKKIKQQREYKEALKNIQQEIFSAEYPIDMIKNHGIRSLFSNQSIITLIFEIAITILCFLIIASAFPISYKTNRKFKFIEQDSIKYVSVYSDSEIMVLEEVEITDGKAKIFTSNQRIIPTKDGISYKLVEFEKVEKMNIEKINSNEDNITNNGESLE